MTCQQRKLAKVSLAKRHAGCQLVESVSLVLLRFAKQALFTAEVATAMPAFVTRADAGWGCLLVAAPVADRMAVAVSVASITVLHTSQV
jgi:hypothetical protein